MQQNMLGKFAFGSKHQSEGGIEKMWVFYRVYALRGHEVVTNSGMLTDFCGIVIIINHL